jgi:hypothetical protein
VGELEKYKLDLVGVQEVRWEGEGYQTADNYTHGREYYMKNVLGDFSVKLGRWDIFKQIISNESLP